jgi:hypothetical protein
VRSHRGGCDGLSRQELTENQSSNESKEGEIDEPAEADARDPDTLAAATFGSNYSRLLPASDTNVLVNAR